MSEKAKSTEFKLPEEEKQMRKFMSENHAHRLLRTKDGMIVLIGDDIPPQEDEG